MGELKLYGMRGAYGEIVATAVKRQHEPQRAIGDLLGAEINEKQARPIMHDCPRLAVRGVDRLITDAKAVVDRQRARVEWEG